MTKQLGLLLCLILTLLLLSACGTRPTTTLPSVADNADVQQLLTSAQRAGPEQAATLKLEAARLLVEDQQIDTAVSILESIDKRRLPPQLGLDIASLQAKLLLQNNKSAQALDSLDFRQLPPQLTNEQVIQLNQLRAEAFSNQQDYINAARELIAASQMTTEQNIRQMLHTQIWGLLTSASNAQLNSATDNRGNNYTEQGWFERASAVAGITDFGEQQEKLFDWQLLWDQHPAAELPPQDPDALIATELSPIQLPTAGIQRTALLLPMTGELANIARIITEGYVTAMQAAGSSDTELVLLNSTEIHTPEQLFYAARTQGANFIVGPLERSFVNQLADYPEHPITVLALNPALEGNNPPLQLDLSSDHEALALVQKALDMGYHNAMIIHSDTRSGQRFEQLIREEYEQRGGFIRATLGFKATQSNSEQVRELLLQDPEIARTMPNRSRSGMSVNVRHETDVIFMAAEAGDARLIRPMLMYHFAGAIPVMATSQVYEGNASASRDTDLNGITFVDLPWRIAEPSPTRLQLLELRDNADTDLGKLYALGADAYLISQNLPTLLSQDGILAGETGNLQLGPNRRLSRALVWAEFVNGEPQLITE
ncbi:penicillin-binding protein activator [Nitrincola sp.]|uniref:penicillin-binding protein activator n=1 Tax=Nitrincola sp. TaxID=1926584 RepID=UPI003A93B9C3